jgi:hypothetical protein
VSAYRLWVNDPAGSPNCPGNLVNGCYNTDAYDPNHSPLCYDPQQFADFASMLAYATGRGETLTQTSAAGAASLCSLKAPAPSAPAGGTTTTTTPPSAPAGGTTTTTGTAAAGCNGCGASAPSSSTTPGGAWLAGVAGGRDTAVPLPTQTVPLPAAAAATTNIPWWLIAAAAVLLFIGSK